MRTLSISPSTFVKRCEGSWCNAAEQTSRMRGLALAAPARSTRTLTRPWRTKDFCAASCESKWYAATAASCRTTSHAPKCASRSRSGTRFESPHAAARRAGACATCLSATAHSRRIDLVSPRQSWSESQKRAEMAPSSTIAAGAPAVPQRLQTAVATQCLSAGSSRLASLTHSAMAPLQTRSFADSGQVERSRTSVASAFAPRPSVLATAFASCSSAGSTSASVTTRRAAGWPATTLQRRRQASTRVPGAALAASIVSVASARQAAQP
mmetsp:Transcript_20087/g.68951  ORF Transcript_20087/g.68951 Transcript_20087/m.68951 type:complete len:268 (-) Transcript_20087:45-848(-)